MPEIQALPRMPELAAEVPCPLCGSDRARDAAVLWPELIASWELTPAETALINRQQGRCCALCGANLRSQTLAAAWLDLLEWRGTLETLVVSARVSSLRVLEINEAGALSPFLRRCPGHVFAPFPRHDMQHLELPEGHFDFVIHSDTLEHVPDPVQGLRECRRVLRPGGALLLTIPLLPSRLTRRRDGLPPSYHGNPTVRPEDFLVRTEYGADYFLDFIAAGWTRCEWFTLGTPASLALVARKPAAR